MKTPFIVVMVLIIQSSENFARVTTAELSWHVRNYDLVGALFLKKEHHDFLQDLIFELINRCGMGLWKAL